MKIQSYEIKEHFGGDYIKQRKIKWDLFIFNTNIYMGLSLEKIKCIYKATIIQL